MPDEKPDDQPMDNLILGDPELHRYRKARADLAERELAPVSRPEAAAYLRLFSGIARDFADAFEVFEPSNVPHLPMRALFREVLDALQKSTDRVLLVKDPLSSTSSPQRPS